MFIWCRQTSLCVFFSLSGSGILWKRLNILSQFLHHTVAVARYTIHGTRYTAHGTRYTVAVAQSF